MKSEAALLYAAAQDGSDPVCPMIAATGGDPLRAENAAREFATAGAAGLVSFGIAGGLDPALQPGDLILAEGVRLPDEDVISTQASWRTALAAAAAGTADGLMYGSDLAVSQTDDKARLFTDYGVRAVDMESHGVARAARETGLPFLIVRAIADPADRTIPPAALAGLGPDGEQRPIAVMLAMLRNPAQVPALIQLARDAKTALRRLAAAAPSVVKSAPV
ncbi:MAG: hypothetical protein OXT06_11200 [Rhodospirillaceae bacterium]|nr:hypothetical protein [Rhodospirillaceae bacterium]MDD9918642.1 hypothetical protein [Rhodospirillaceae bacterium]MDD9928946.1 hypothetical protein [Rhodospirillaceae bacterium]